MPRIAGVYYELCEGDRVVARAESVGAALSLLGVIFEARSLHAGLTVAMRRRVFCEGETAPAMGFIPPTPVPRPPLHLAG